jgi:hypothetical protein
VPELLQDAVTSRTLAEHLLPFLEEGPLRMDTIAGLNRVRDRLGEGGAAARTAAIALELLDSS